MLMKLSNCSSTSSITDRYDLLILSIHARSSGWWEWKPQKRHLEGLFTAGKVMVVERRNFQRVYDLTHRVMPHWDDERDPLSQEDAESVMLDNSARSLGIFREQWLADYYRLKRPALKNWCNERAEQQQIIPVDVEGLGTLWLHSHLQPLLEQALAGKLTATHSAVLSPLIRWFGIVNGQSSYSILATGWSVTRQHQNVSTVISSCRCCTAGSWLGEWMPKCTVKRACWT